MDINNTATSAVAIIQFTPDNRDRRISILQAAIKLKIFSGRSARFGGSRRSSLYYSTNERAKVRDPSRSLSYEFVPQICFPLSPVVFPPVEQMANGRQNETVPAGHHFFSIPTSNNDLWSGTKRIIIHPTRFRISSKEKLSLELSTVIFFYYANNARKVSIVRQFIMFWFTASIVQDQQFQHA